MGDISAIAPETDNIIANPTPGFKNANYYEGNSEGEMLKDMKGGFDYLNQSKETQRRPLNIVSPVKKQYEEVSKSNNCQDKSTADCVIHSNSKDKHLVTG